MKLNLLPTSVTQGEKAKVAWIVSGAMVAASLVILVLLMFVTQRALAEQKARVEELRPLAERALQVSEDADSLISASMLLTRNIRLTEEMAAHNLTYARFYRGLFPYIPSFYRVKSLEATPISETSCRVNFDGWLSTYQQYADLMLALLRIPGSKTLSRGGYANDPYSYLPPVTVGNQRPGSGVGNEAISDPVRRLQAAIAKAQATPYGFESSEAFKSLNPNSSITASVLLEQDMADPASAAMDYNLLAPNPFETFKGQLAKAANNSGGAPAIPPAGPGM